MSGEKGATTAATMETQREAKAPRLPSEPKPLLTLSRAASHGVGWAQVDHLGSPKDTHKNERAAQRSLFSLSVSQQIALASCLLESSAVHHSAAQLSSSFYFQAPVILSIMISAPLRHPVFLSVLKGEKTVWQRLFAKRADDPKHPQKDLYLKL